MLDENFDPNPPEDMLPVRNVRDLSVLGWSFTNADSTIVHALHSLQTTRTFTLSASAEVWNAESLLASEETAVGSQLAYISHTRNQSVHMEQGAATPRHLGKDRRVSRGQLSYQLQSRTAPWVRTWFSQHLVRKKVSD
jgi:hypothetical protein